MNMVNRQVHCNSKCFIIKLKKGYLNQLINCIKMQWYLKRQSYIRKLVESKVQTM